MSNFSRSAAVAACLVLASCAGLPKLTESMPSPAARPVAESPTELYTRIARAALTCWFGANGVLKADYTYQGEAAPPSRGGKATITVRTRQPGVPNQRGVRVYTVSIMPKGETAELDIVNQRMPEPAASDMKSDVERWAAGDGSCRQLPQAQPAPEIVQPKPKTAEKKAGAKNAAAKPKPKAAKPK